MSLLHRLVYNYSWSSIMYPLISIHLFHKLYKLSPLIGYYDLYDRIQVYSVTSKTRKELFLIVSAKI